MAFQILSDLEYEETIFYKVENLPEATRSWYLEKVVGSDRLLIVVGDSWTWGDCLGNTSLSFNDESHRNDHIYGAILAKKINADLLNLAVAGGSNIRFFHLLSDALKKVHERYSKIDVVVTLTELCREIIDDPAWCVDLDYTNIHTLLMSYERRMLSEFQRLFNTYAINFVIARNFSLTYKENINICPGHVPLAWVQVLEQNQKLGIKYPDTIRFISKMGLNPLVKFVNRANLSSEWKKDLVEMFVDAEIAIDWLDLSKFNYKLATRHPTEKGHELWAEYLYHFVK